MGKWIGLFVLLLAVGLSACGSGQEAVNTSAPDVVPEEPLMAWADSLEQAQEIAQQYEITLVNFEQGVATFYTEEDPQNVIDRGIQNEWPELSLNRISNHHKNG